MIGKFIPLSVPNLKGKELEYITCAVETEWVSTGGPYVNDFEMKVAEYVKCKGAVSCQNGTSGLHIALEVCGVTKDDEVIVPTLTFIAAVNPVKYSKFEATPLTTVSDTTRIMSAKFEKTLERSEGRNSIWAIFFCPP